MYGDPLWAHRHPHVYHAYRWQPVRVAKVRGVLRVETDREPFALKRVQIGEERLRLLERLNTTLMEKEYRHTLPWVKTTYGDPFYVDRDGAFYATPWFGKEWSAEASLADDALVTSLAEMHRLTEETELIKGDTAPPTFEKHVSQWKEHLRRVRSYAELAKQREIPSPFDVALLERVDELEQAASFAIRGFKRLSEKKKAKPFRRVFCHRRIHPHNLVCRRGQWKWIDFDHAGADVPQRDLAAYMHHFPLSQEEDLVEKLQGRLDAYVATFPLSLAEKQLLCLYLVYPHNVIQWLHRYYKGKRSRDELFYVQRLDQSWTYFQGLKRLVKRTWSRGDTARKTPALINQ